MTTLEVTSKEKTVFHFTANPVEAEIQKMYPGAETLFEFVRKYKKLTEGDMIVNHPDVPPTFITEEMLEHNFPSISDSMTWYIVTEPQRAFEFLKRIKARDDALDMINPSKRLTVKFDPDTWVTRVSGKTVNTAEEYSFEFKSLDKLYEWLSAVKDFHVCTHCSLKPVYIVYDRATGGIVSSYETLSPCAEDAEEQFRQTRRDTVIGNIYVPWGMTSEHLVDRKMEVFKF